MKKIIFLSLLFISTLSISQVGIGTTSPDASSVLDITATDAGLLVPRLTTTQRDALSSPATGLLIFNTTTRSFQYNFGDGSSVDWYSLDAQSDSSSASYSYMVPIWAEEKLELQDNAYEWAFGNGAETPTNSGITIYVPSNYTCAIVAMTATTSNDSGNSKIEADVLFVNKYFS